MDFSIFLGRWATPIFRLWEKGTPKFRIEYKRFQTYLKPGQKHRITSHIEIIWLSHIPCKYFHAIIVSSNIYHTPIFLGLYLKMNLNWRLLQDLSWERRLVPKLGEHIKGFKLISSQYKSIKITSHVKIINCHNYLTNITMLFLYQVIFAILQRSLYV